MAAGRSKRTKEARRAPMGTDANLKPRQMRGRTDAPATPVVIREKGVVLEDSLRDYIRQRVGFKLGKFAESIERVSVRLEDLNGPKGSPAERCALKVVITRHESVMVEVVDAEYRVAFDAALDAGERAVRRTLERVKTKARRRV